MSNNKFQSVKSQERVENLQVVDLEKQTSPDLHWVNVNFAVKNKPILSDCWGNVPSGSICAILGPSGAGKSSLLNVLAGRSASAVGITITGKVTVGGKVIDPVAFRRNIAYVMQDDALMATATPREALNFSASMRLPSSVSREEIRVKVDKLLEDLGIMVCADVMIGGALIKGISGGQRKRTSVGVELITNPSLLFLDEPTSGLDSFSAFSLVTLLKDLARKDCTILFTIHQPSSDVFFLFDLVIFMKEGRIFYQGPVKGIVSYFSSYGYDCPSNYNPADYIMAITQSESIEVLEEKKVFMSIPEELLIEDKNSESIKNHKAIEFVSESSFMKQLAALSYREIISTKRDTVSLIARFGITIFLNLLFGLIFLGAGGRDNADNTNFVSHFGSITMVLVSGMFGAAQPVMLSFPFERPMFMREYSTGTYGVVAYFLSKLVTEIPLNFATTIVQFILDYFMINLQGSFITIVLAVFGLSMCSCSVAVALGCSVTNVKDVTELAPLLFVPQMLFVGFFVATSDIPAFLRWAQWLCSLKYAMNIVLLTEFSLANPSCQGAASANCESILNTNSINSSDTYIYALCLFAIFAGFRIIGAMILVQKAKKFY